MMGAHSFPWLIATWVFGDHHPDAPLFIPLLLAPIWIALGLFLRARKPFFEQIEARRQAAAREETPVVSLAAEQPLPDEAALDLPITIKLGPRCTVLVAYAALLCGAFNVYFLLAPPPDSPIPQFAALVGSILAIWFLGRYIWERLEVSQEGLTLHQSSDTIRWEEARLFALIPMPQRNLPPMYELFGPYTIARWHRVRRATPFLLNIYKPALPFDEYNRQMDVLLSVIAARTGLPLYDLR